MIDRGWLALSVCVLLSACADDRAPDFCRNHAVFHDEHLSTLAHLNVVMSADGSIRSELSVPVAVFGDVPVDVLAETGKVYSLQSERECSDARVTLDRSDGRVIAGFESSCGADNKIGQLDMLLFDNLPGLDEVEVEFVTPVTRKHFAIHRQCESAIFRLQQGPVPGDSGQ